MRRLALALLLTAPAVAACGHDEPTPGAAVVPSTSEPVQAAEPEPAAALADGDSPGEPPAPPDAPADPSPSARVPAVRPAPTPPAPVAAVGATVAVAVTGAGFEPSRIALPAGVMSRLVFTRTSEGTCATSVRSPALTLAETPLPLNEPVTVEVTPAERGSFTFACGMDMVSGVIVAE